MSTSEKRTIKALVCDKLGDPSSSKSFDVLKVKQIPAPHLPPNCVRIKILASALNFADSLQIQGKYQEVAKPPFVPGAEVSGVISEIGLDVRNLKVGDTVCAVTAGGAFAEETVAQAISVVKIPASSDVENAAGLPVAFGTAWMALRDRANVQPGQIVVILGAAGGVGLAAVQISKILGATVIAVARGESKMFALKFAGADICIDLSRHTIEELPILIKKAAPKEGVDVVFDPVGGPFFTAGFKSLKWGGQIIIVGFASGKIPAIPANIALVKNITIHGLYWGANKEKDPALYRRSLEEVAKLYAGGDIFVHVSHKYSLEQGKEAFSVLMNRGAIGKLLLVPGTRSML
jgi:NADPH2:quinone reductase